MKSRNQPKPTSKRRSKRSRENSQYKRFEQHLRLMGHSFDRSSDEHRRTALLKRLFKDGPPSWNVGKRNHPCASSQDAARERRDVLKRLRRSRTIFDKLSDPGQAIYLEKLLKACRPAYRCLSPACPECSRAFQRLFVETVEALTKKAHTWSIITIVPKITLHPGDLNLQERIIALKRSVDQALGHIGVRRAVGALDLSVNEHAQGDFHPHWRLHIWLLVPGTISENAKTTLKFFFPQSPLILRPIKVQQFDGDSRALAYAMKYKFDRRVTLNATASHSQYVKPRKLRKDQFIETLLLLHQMDFQGRLYLLGGTLPKLSQFEGRTNENARSKEACSFF